MASGVNTFDWRAKTREVRHEHTSEVRSETLPPEVQALLLDMADRLVKLERAVHDFEHRIDPIERTMKTLAAEAAKRVAA